MTGPWAAGVETRSSATFETLHSGLTVELIATPRTKLKTCATGESVAAIIHSNTQGYDFIPVLADGGSGDIIGLLHAADPQVAAANGLVADHMLPLSEQQLVGADSSILNFIIDADEKPCRLVVSRSGIAGLVTLSDLQKLPVRAALFALVTGLEIAMSELIRQELDDDTWLVHLTPSRREMVWQEIEISKRADGLVDTLLFTQFCDKAEIVRKAIPLNQSKTQLAQTFGSIQKLRDALAHANEYAASAAEAKQVCKVVRCLLAVQKEILERTSLEPQSNRQP
jgi:hypothetical protein